MSATAPEGIGRAWTYALATGAAGVVVMVVAVSAACSVFARLQVAHIHFFLCFVHMTFLHLLAFWVVSVAPNSTDSTRNLVAIRITNGSA